MAHTADHQAGGVGFGHLLAERFGEAEVERSTPATGEEDDVVVGHVEIADRAGVADLGAELVVGEEAVVIGACG